jgi:hypothetical protein
LPDFQKHFCQRKPACKTRAGGAYLIALRFGRGPAGFDQLCGPEFHHFPYPAFFRQILPLSLGLFGCLCRGDSIEVFYRYAAECLSLLWREWMTCVLVKSYFFNHAFYRRRSSHRVDNAD